MHVRLFFFFNSLTAQDEITSSSYDSVLTYILNTYMYFKYVCLIEITYFISVIVRIVSFLYI